MHKKEIGMGVISSGENGTYESMCILSYDAQSREILRAP